VVNALRDIETAREIEIRLQSNEVLVHLPSDTPISAVSDAIYEAGYAPEEVVRLQAKGQWSQQGFVPSGWTEPIAVGALLPSALEGNIWELVFSKTDGTWNLSEVKPLSELPRVRDED